MKKLSINLLTNVMLLLAGIIFLLSYNIPHILDWVARTIGVMFLLPSIVFLFMLALRKPQEGRSSDFMAILPTLGGICFSIVMLIKPEMFGDVIVMLLGILLVVLGLFHFFFLMLSYKRVGTRMWYFFCPLLVLGAGIVILCVKSPTLDENMVVLITGISLLLFNFTSLQEYLGVRKNRPTDDVTTEVVEPEATDVEI